MEFSRNVLIIDNSVKDRDFIKSEVTFASKKIVTFTLSGRQNFAEITAQNKMKCMYMNTNIGKKDVFFILRFFSMLKEKDGSEITIFLASDDYEMLAEITAEFPLEKLLILHTPLDVGDLVKKIQIAVLGKVESSAHGKVSKDPLNIDLEFVNVFITATKKVMVEMADIQDLKSSKPKLMATLKEPLDIAISSKILISSAYFKGSYYIAFPASTFLNLYEKVVMEKQTEITNDNKDFASELANIIYGQCKKKFSDDGLNLEMVIPSLHMGEIKYDVVILIPFECYLGKFYLAVAPGLI
ncbi:chemotaxis protein CheX [Bacteriovorax sp. PP10]|uniref:Chemotaxis protein CheX n=1 Tax=Bacteriovorax antarcticus TaxID=3088717 RepID=A0ABU5W1I1_9BACT|nr:chemotaxis protein CheX [Bacteriovorax sp. PP10]MEA9358115.1 chemotaxis protein CheX [Bacteriovorax sp. PP10]